MAENEVTLNLKKLVSELDSYRIKQAMQDACAIVMNDAKQNAPHKTGELQRSIDFEVSDDGTEGVIYSDLDYSVYVEIGSGIYSSKGTGRKDVPWKYQDAKGDWHTTYGQAPQPYLEPALNQNTSKIIDCFEGLLE